MTTHGRTRDPDESWDYTLLDLVRMRRFQWGTYNEVRVGRPESDGRRVLRWGRRSSLTINGQPVLTRKDGVWLVISGVGLVLGLAYVLVGEWFGWLIIAGAGVDAVTSIRRMPPNRGRWALRFGDADTVPQEITSEETK